MDLYGEFTKWLDELLENNDMPENTAAFCFNLYEESAEDSVYGVQLIASESFDANDDEWACDEVWSSEEDIFCVELSDEDERDWKAAQTLLTGWAREYLARGKYGRILTSSGAVGIGFVDGDLDIIYNTKNTEA